MLEHLHTTLQRLLHDRGNIPRDQVDVRFDAPTREWVQALLRPTLDFFLFDTRENIELRHTNLESTRRNGRAIYRVPARRFDLRYMVSALTTTVEDEHLLLWRTLLTLLKNPELSGELLPEPLRGVNPPIVAQVRAPEEAGLLVDLWSGFDTPPRPALLYVVTVPVDLGFGYDSPLVLTRTARYHDRDAPGAPDVRRHIGGVVRNRAGTALVGADVSRDGSALPPSVTDGEGRFLLAGVPEGPVALRVSRAEKPAHVASLRVPADSYDIVVD